MGGVESAGQQRVELGKGCGVEGGEEEQESRGEEHDIRAPPIDRTL